jgi:hypothetical protein
MASAVWKWCTASRATCQGEMAGAWVSVHLRVGLCALPAPRVWELAGLGLLSASASAMGGDCFSFPHVDPKVSQSFLESNGCWDHMMAFQWFPEWFPQWFPCSPVSFQAVGSRFPGPSGGRLVTCGGQPRAHRNVSVCEMQKQWKGCAEEKGHEINDFERMNGWVNASMIEWNNYWMNQWMKQWIREWVNERINEWRNEWTNEGTNEWTNEWMNLSMNPWISEPVN